MTIINLKEFFYWYRTDEYISFIPLRGIEMGTGKFAGSRAAGAR